MKTTNEILPLQMEPGNGVNSHRQTLRQRYLDTLAGHQTAETTLRHVVNQLLELNIGRKQLVCWAVEAGHNERTIRTLLSRILCRAGHRARSAGAGRRIPEEAMAILAFADVRFGGKAERFLYAAARAARGRRLAQSSEQLAA